MTAYLQYRIDKGALSLRRPQDAAERFVQMLFGPVHVALIHGREMMSGPQLRQHVEETVLVFLGGIGRLELESMDPA
jgi:AefR-like transcriptional repressor, C-terminal domain